MIIKLDKIGIEMPIMALHDDLKWLLGKWFIKKHGVSPKVFPLGLRRFPDNGECSNI